jgi:alkylhydroperoxidase/carboxymuconolactone decarboxylase family protein YurZ
MYLPEIFKTFLEEHKTIANALQHVGELSAVAGPIDQKTQHLIQLGISIGAESKGAVRSHARRALDAGATPAEITQTVLMSVTIVGFPAMIAAYGWVKEVIEPQDLSRAPG